MTKFGKTFTREGLLCCYKKAFVGGWYEVPRLPRDQCQSFNVSRCDDLMKGVGSCEANAIVGMPASWSMDI